MVTRKTIILIFAAIVLNISAQDTLKINIDDAIKLSTENQPAIQQAIHQLNVIDAKIDQQKSFNYPSVDATLDYTRMGPVPSISLPGGGEFKLYPENNYDTKINVFYNLYDFNKNESVINLINSQKMSIKERVNQIKNNLSYRAAQTFYSLLYLEKVIDVKNEEIATLQKHLEDVNKRIENGTATDYDALSTEVRITSAESQLNDIEKAYQKYSIGLKNLLNISTDKPLSLVGTLPDNYLDKSLDMFRNDGFQNREEIKVVQSEIKTIQLQKHVASISELPSLNLFANYGFKNGYVPNLDAMRGNFVAGVNAEIPIFNGFRKDAKVAESEANLKIKSDEIDGLKRKIKNEVEQAYSDMKKDMKKKKLAEAQLDAAQKAVKKAVIQYNTGTVTNLDILDAETHLSEAQLQYEQTIYQLTLDYYKLLETSGKRLW